MLLVPALLVAAAGPLQDGAPAGAWRALATPAICRSAPPAIVAPRLVRGSHLVVTADDLDPGYSAASGPVLAPPAFASLLGEESRREGWSLSLHPSSPPFLVRGPDAGRQAAEAFVAELDRAGQALEIDVSIWLARGAGSGASGATLPKGPAWGHARVRSGLELTFGERSAQSYVHNYSVEVATDAGVAAPVVGRALTGDLVHLRAMRVRGGTGVYVEGLLDLTRLLSLEDFELSATDLGSVQHPKVHTLQVAFSGTVASGAPLRIAWGGLAGEDASSEGSLWIVPKTTADPSDGRWRVVDTALVEAPVWDLPAVEPGGGLASLEETPGDSALPQPIASALLAKESESGRALNSRARSAFAWGHGVVLGPRADQEGWAAIEGLHEAVESLRTETSELVLQRGATFVRLPVANGTRWRVLAGEETTAVIDYDVEIAPETWMPGPRVERSIDGFCAQGVAGTGHTSYSAWVAATPEKRIAERSSVPLGRLELPRRTWRAARGEIAAGAPPTTALNGEASLSLAFTTP